ncbi:hypothetical protein M0802_001506 [Mischocyttarus mexicanus]|nr:hypothetical protein M0802_001506 [Mischocyttarus mexicanus]
MVSVFIVVKLAISEDRLVAVQRPQRPRCARGLEEGSKLLAHSENPEGMLNPFSSRLKWFSAESKGFEDSQKILPRNLTWR